MCIRDSVIIVTATITLLRVSVDLAATEPQVSKWEFNGCDRLTGSVFDAISEVQNWRQKEGKEIKLPNTARESFEINQVYTTYAVG